MSRRKSETVRVEMLPRDGVIDPPAARFLRSKRKGETLHIAYDLHFDEQQTAQLAYCLLSMLPAMLVVTVLAQAIEHIPGVREALKDIRSAVRPEAP